MIEIDGGYLEGGGQILRTAVALSAITKKPIHIFNIRKKREKPGLRHQHLEGILAAARICNAEIKGAELNSTDIEFIPKEIKGGTYNVWTKTAGSITLILQTLIPLGIYADKPLRLNIKGGTAVPFSPTITYFEKVFCYYMKRMGIAISVEIKRHGFYPKGGGEVNACINNPGALQPVEFIDCGVFKRVEVTAFASEYLRNAKVGERLIQGFQRIIPEAVYKYNYVSADSPGCFIQGIGVYENCLLGADALGKRGIAAEEIGKEAGISLKEILSADTCVDNYMIDQIIPYVALATAETKKIIKLKFYKMTLHAQTNVWLVEKFLPVKFEVVGNILMCRLSG